MKIDYLPSALKALEEAPSDVRKAFFKQIKFLGQNLRHPSLHAKKYDEGKDRWQARVNRDWRFYFNIVGDTYIIRDILRHPKLPDPNTRLPASAVEAIASGFRYGVFSECAASPARCL